MSALNRKKWVTARKPHVCYDCGGKIKAGERCLYAITTDRDSGAYPGKILAGYFCDSCTLLQETEGVNGNSNR